MADDASKTPPPADPDTARRQRDEVERLLARDAAVSSGSVTLGGAVHDYTVHAAFLPVAASGLAAAGAPPEAAVFTTAYLKKGVAPAERPVCFAFNGGPGSASVWLHLGALGPKRVVVPDDGHAGAAVRAWSTTRRAGSSTSTSSSSTRRTPAGRSRRATRRARSCWRRRRRRRRWPR
jgi:hypothetical protein